MDGIAAPSTSFESLSNLSTVSYDWPHVFGWCFTFIVLVCMVTMLLPVDRAEVGSQMRRRLRLNRIAEEKMRTEAIAGTETIE